MQDFKNAVKELAKKYNFNFNEEHLLKIEDLLSICKDIKKFATGLKNDPNSLINNINENVEFSLVEHKADFLNSFSIMKNVYNEPHEQFNMNIIFFYYKLFNGLLFQIGYSEGLAHIFSVQYTKFYILEEIKEQTNNYSIEFLGSFCDKELEKLKLKSELTFSIIDLSTGRKSQNSRVNKFINSIELAKKISTLNQNLEIAQKSTINNCEPKNDKFETLKSNLYDNGFFEITKVKSLTHDGQSKLIDLLELNDTPYIIAMFDFLGYFKYLTNEYGLTNSKIHSKVGSWLNTNTQTIKCNMLVLNEKSALRENNRYTAHLHKEKVKTDYNALK